MSLAPLVADHRIVVCVGSGGVGKTTVAATLALHAAMQGRRAMVLTIDPARRLAQSLGLSELRSEGQRIDPKLLADAGIDVPGVLSAGMLDQKSAWDEFIARHAPNEEACRTILENEFYQQMSRSFAGSTEYMAIEELCRIDESGEHDLIVLDTPPTGHALDFLEAPQRLEDFLDRSMIGWFVKPYAAVGWSAWKTASRTVKFVFERIEQATGVETLRQISEFFMAMEAMFDGIADRSRRVRAVLKSDRTAFVLVTGPDEQVLGQGEMLTEKMAALGMPLRGVVLNRLHPLPEIVAEEVDPVKLRAAVVEILDAVGIDDARIADWITANHVDAEAQAGAEAIRREMFESGLPPGIETTGVPELEGDVHDLASLARLSQLICARDDADS
jgi:anion-transporting  ArsA/GET3 family ATPase